MAKPVSSNSDVSNWPWLWILPAGLAALLPLLLYWNHFSKFFYQGDEWDQLNEMNTLGYLPWVFKFFGENFVPVFKLYWSGLLFVGNGNHFFLIVSNFILHALVVILFGCLLRMWSVGFGAVLFSQLILALNYTGIEILSQSIQASNLLCYLIFLLTLIVLSRGSFGKGLSARACLLIAILSGLGALSFVRGMLIGPAIFGSCLLFKGLGQSGYKPLWRPALWALVPCLIVGVFVAINTFENPSGGTLIASKLQGFGKHLFFQLSFNPLYQQIRGLETNVVTALVLLFLNIMIVAGSLYWAKKSQRILLSIFILFFVANAVLLAYGRSHLPVDHIPGWRYQYIAILAFAPLAGIWLEKFVCLIPNRVIRLVGYSLILLWCALYVFKPWSRHLPSWSEDRGTRTRILMDSPEIDPQGIEITRFGLVTNQKARELRDKFNLH